MERENKRWWKEEVSTPRGASTFVRYGWVPKPKADETTYDNLGDGWKLLIAFWRYFPDYLLLPPARLHCRWNVAEQHVLYAATDKPKSD